MYDSVSGEPATQFCARTVNPGFDSPLRQTKRLRDAFRTTNNVAAVMLCCWCRERGLVPVEQWDLLQSGPPTIRPEQCNILTSNQVPPKHCMGVSAGALKTDCCHPRAQTSFGQ
jgi:hypothetical protein